MVNTIYINLKDITLLQQRIMHFVDNWVRAEKTPVPQGEIIKHMKREGVKSYTAVNALRGLERKGYLRRSSVSSNKTLYVQLRRV